MPLLALDPADPGPEDRSLARQLQDEMAAGLVRAVGTVPEQRLQQLMRTPLRRVVLDGLFWGLPRALDGTRAGEVTTSVRCHVTGRPDGTFDIYSLRFSDGAWHTERGANGAEPELTVTVDGAQLLELALKRSSPLQAYLSGRLRASGDPRVAARLTLLFRGTPAPDG